MADNYAHALAELGARYWEGEAEIVRAFFARPPAREDHIRWLRLQVFKEMYGSGLTADPKGLIQALLERLNRSFPRIAELEGRREFLRTAQVLHEEFGHYCLFADILEEVTGEAVPVEKLAEWQLPEDRKLQELRQQIREQAGTLGQAAVDFTEGGRAAMFAVASKVGGDPLLDRIAAACRVVYEEELEHQEHGAHEIEALATTPDEWRQITEMVEAICRQRLRMRNEMFGFPLSEQRLEEIAAGKTATG